MGVCSQMEVHAGRVAFPSSCSALNNAVFRSRARSLLFSFLGTPKLNPNADTLSTQYFAIYNKMLFVSSKVIFRTKRRHRQMSPKQNEHLSCETDGDL